MSRYIGLIDGVAGAYGIVFPDLPGCTSMGNTIEEVLANGADAVRLWVESMQEDGHPVPPPSSYETLRRDPEIAAAVRDGASIGTVPLIRNTGRPVRANLSLDAGVLAVIDAEADRRKITRSALIEVMAKEYLPRLS